MRYLLFFLSTACITTKPPTAEEVYRSHNEQVLEELDFEEEDLDDLPEAGEDEEDTGTGTPR
tara:strand:+ start:173 stop:358 length:186 start_codon:yes stop_codon:yes gene_type:complete